MLKAPYNFVPLKDDPYLPEWAAHISQDIPFEDGISGTLQLSIEAKTPVFVGDEMKEYPELCEFCHVADADKKHYFIPGTSVKGMLRSVMEILSFGKMLPVQGNRGIPQSLLTTEEHDLCECIFGFTGPRESLKGRVHFSPAKLTGTPSFIDNVDLTLAKPQPSYYPLYLGKGQTWNSGNIRIAGRKRYPVRGENQIFNNIGSENTCHKIEPMRTGSVFEETIRFHNLRPVELGALLSAIDFCGHEFCYHNIGQGKPLGYGKVKLTVTSTEMRYLCDNDRSCTPEAARAAFIEEMRHFSRCDCNDDSLPLSWQELFAMAIGIPEGLDEQFQYMQLNKFAQEKEEYNRQRENEEERENAGLKTFWNIISRKKRLTGIADFHNSIRARQQARDMALQQARDMARQQAQEKARQAREACERGEYTDARRLYEEAAGYGFNTYQNEINEIMRRKKAREIALSANEASQKGEYERARQLYQEAAGYGFKPYQDEIAMCEERIRSLSGDISSYLAPVALGSIKAFANRLGSRHRTQPITPADIPFITQKIKTDWSKLNNSQKKEWLNRGKWTPLEPILGEEAVKEMYNSVKEYHENQ